MFQDGRALPDVEPTADVTHLLDVRSHSQGLGPQLHEEQRAAQHQKVPHRLQLLSSGPQYLHFCPGTILGETS